MKQKRFLLLLTFALMLCASVTPAAAKTDKSTPAPADPVYRHVDVRTLGSMTVTTVPASGGESSETVSATVTNVRVFLLGEGNTETELSMRGPLTSEDRAYPLEYQSVKRNLGLSSDARFRVNCTLTYRLGNREQSFSGDFSFTAADSTCKGGANNYGADFVVTAAQLVNLLPSPSVPPVLTPSTPPSTPPVLTPSTPPSTPPVLTPSTSPSTPPVLTPSTPPSTPPVLTPSTSPSTPPVLTPSTSPVVTPGPSNSTAPSPTRWIVVPPRPAATATPRPTPTPYLMPRTGETTDLWLVLFVLAGLCAVAGAVLLYVRRAHGE